MIRAVFHNLFPPAAHPNFSKIHGLMKRWYETILGDKYVSTYKSLPYKNAGI
jgi:hypothetical protein